MKPSPWLLCLLLLPLHTACSCSQHGAQPPAQQQAAAAPRPAACPTPTLRHTTIASLIDATAVDPTLRHLSLSFAGEAGAEVGIPQPRLGFVWWKATTSANVATLQAALRQACPHTQDAFQRVGPYIVYLASDEVRANHPIARTGVEDAQHAFELGATYHGCSALITADGQGTPHLSDGALEQVTLSLPQASDYHNKAACCAPVGKQQLGFAISSRVRFQHMEAPKVTFLYLPQNGASLLSCQGLLAVRNWQKRTWGKLSRPWSCGMRPPIDGWDMYPYLAGQPASGVMVDYTFAASICPPAAEERRMQAATTYRAYFLLWEGNALFCFQAHEDIFTGF